MGVTSARVPRVIVGGRPTLSREPTPVKPRERQGGGRAGAGSCRRLVGLHRSPGRLHALRADELPGEIRRAGLASAPLKMGEVRLLPVTAPLAALRLEVLGYLREPRFWLIPHLRARDHVDGEPVTVPAEQIGGRIGDRPAGRKHGAAARVVHLLELVRAICLVDEGIEALRVARGDGRLDGGAKPGRDEREVVAHRGRRTSTGTHSTPSRGGPALHSCGRNRLSSEGGGPATRTGSAARSEERRVGKEG